MSRQASTILGFRAGWLEEASLPGAAASWYARRTLLDCDEIESIGTYGSPSPVGRPVGRGGVGRPARRWRARRCVPRPVGPRPRTWSPARHSTMSAASATAGATPRSERATIPDGRTRIASGPACRALLRGGWRPAPRPRSGSVVVGRSHTFAHDLAVHCRPAPRRGCEHVGATSMFRTRHFLPCLMLGPAATKSALIECSWSSGRGRRRSWARSTRWSRVERRLAEARHPGLWMPSKLYPSHQGEHVAAVLADDGRCRSPAGRSSRVA